MRLIRVRPAAKGAILKILVVSLQPMSEESVQPLLEQAGLEVLVAGCDPDELTSAFSQGPDLVLLELPQCGPGGLSICLQVRSRSHVPIVVVGRYAVADAVAAMQLSAADYVPRPVGSRDLLVHINAAVRDARRLSSPAHRLTEASLQSSIESSDSCPISSVFR